MSFFVDGSKGWGSAELSYTTPVCIGRDQPCRGAGQRPMVRCRKVQIRAFIQACWALSAAPPWPPSVFSQ